MPTISALLSQHNRAYSTLARQLKAVIIVVSTVQVVRLRTNQWPVSALGEIFHPFAKLAILNWRCLHLQNFAYAFVLTKVHVVLSVITPKIPTTCSSWTWSTGFVFQFYNCPTVARLPYLAIIKIKILNKLVCSPFTVSFPFGVQLSSSNNNSLSWLFLRDLQD